MEDHMSGFVDRSHAGSVLATRLTEFTDRDDVIVLALPRGGVPVGFEVARALHAPLDILTVRKLGAPGHEELAIGAIASGGLMYLDRDAAALFGVTRPVFEATVRREVEELNRRDRLYRGNRPFPSLTGMHVILVDDGLATGASMYAAVSTVRQSSPASIVVAVPVASREAADSLRHVADRVVTATTPEPFYGVGFWYEDFSQTSDHEVLALIDAASRLQLQTSRA
jgi:predicted phosphoribosyltransferase